MSEHRSSSDAAEQPTFTYKSWARYGQKALTRRWNQGRVLRRSKEVFFIRTTDIAYTPLPGPSWIRLLAIQAGKPGDILRCSLRLVDLDLNPSYTALSYTWKEDANAWQTMYSVAKDAAKKYFHGQKIQIEYPESWGELERNKSIMLNGQSTKIFPNLYNALVQLRRRSASSEYWIDALCINQSDQAERTSQVRMMGRIYRSSQLVFVWLGNSSQLALRGIPYLERLAAQDIKLSSLEFKSAEDKMRALGADPKTVYQGLASAICMFMCQWFKRVWVIQEHCLGKQVVFAIDDKELSNKAVLMCFHLIQQFYTDLVPGLDRSGEEAVTDSESGSQIWKFGSIWAPQLRYARETFQNGGMWTLKQWLMACRGRLATDPRDLIFAGIALIRTELTTIDPRVRSNRPALMRGTIQPPLSLRKYYPSLIPAYLEPNDNEASRPNFEEKSPASYSPIPYGLWAALEANYDTNIAEVLVNTAACLLSQASIAELLSLAARTNHPNKYAPKWRVAPIDRLVIEDLPSWVPAPGSWTSRVGKDLALQDSVTFAAGGKARFPPQISHDGLALYLDGARIDQIDRFVLEETTLKGLTFSGLTNLLNFLKELSPMYRGSQTSSFEALCNTLLCSNMAVYDELGCQKDTVLGWFCYSIACAVSRQLLHRRYQEFCSAPRRYNHPDKTNEAFIEHLETLQKEARRKTTELLELYEEVRASHSNERWPLDLDPRIFDQQLCILFSKILFLQATEVKLSPQSPELPQYFRIPSDTRVGKALIEAGKEGLGLIKLDWDIDSDLAILYQHLDEVMGASLSWSKVFVTKDGYIGLGPEWLLPQNWVMLVHGATVPYAFSTVDDDLRIREKDLRAALDTNSESYCQILYDRNCHFIRPLISFVRKREEVKMKHLDDERLSFQQQLLKTDHRIGLYDAWVLLGEVYVEGIMYGEATRDHAGEILMIV